MPQTAEDKPLPADIEAQPLVQAEAALQSVIRGHRDDIEREQRLPMALVERLHAAGFYRMVHVGAPLDNQWKRWPGVAYSLPAQAWVVDIITALGAPRVIGSPGVKIQASDPSHVTFQ